MDESVPLFGGNDEARKRFGRKRDQKNKLCLVLVIIVIIGFVIALTVILVRRNSSSASTLPAAVKTDNIRRHLQALQNIANENSRSPIPSRSVLNNYNQSAEYVEKILGDAGFDVQRQYFQIPVNHEYSGNYLRATFSNVDFNFVEGVEFNVMRYSGNGSVSAPLAVPADPAGCTSDAFSGFPSEAVALLEYTANCSYYDMAMHAVNANAKAVLITYSAAYPNNAPSRSRIVSDEDIFSAPLVEVPVLSGSYSFGQRIRGMLDGEPSLSVSLFANTSVVWTTTYNVLATMQRGSSSTKIIVGSHLDSVPAGPGINDNGSGSSVNLELAVQFAALNAEPKNQVLFAWWGAEELGLLGSKYYVKMLSEAERGDISLNINMDMLASPNFDRGVYNGSAAPSAIATRSETIMQLLQESFCDNNLPVRILPFTGRSDYGSFIDEKVLIPAGAIASGADGSKTMEQRKAFGGLANAPYDTCYHQLCDDIENINATILGEMAQSVANALQVLMNEEDLPSFLKQETASYTDAVECVHSGRSNVINSPPPTLAEALSDECYS